MGNGNELIWGLWLSDNCQFENPDAIILKRTGRLYYKDSIIDMCALYEIFLKNNCLRQMVKNEETGANGDKINFFG